MNINDIVAAIKAGPNDITLYPGASKELIDEFQSKTGIKLSYELQVFYQACNGFESEEDLFRIVPLDEILERIEYDRTNYHIQPNQFYFAEYLVYCDSWKIEVDLQNPDCYKIYGSYGDGPEVVITCSFSEFIGVFLRGGVFEDKGLYKWTDLIQSGL